MWNLTRRYLRLYFRDKTTVFFSLLAVLITLALQLLFLAQLQVDTILSYMGGLIAEDSVSLMVNVCILAGFLSIIPVTSTLGALGHMLYDREDKRLRDFLCAPIPKYQYPCAAILGASTVGTVMTLAAFVFYSIYLYVDLRYMFSLGQYAAVVALTMLIALFSAALMGMIVALLKTTNAFTALSLLAGTLIGFVTGMYIPYGWMPAAAHNAVKVLPFGQASMLTRRVLMDGLLDDLFAQFLQIPQAGEAVQESLRDYRWIYGIDFDFGGTVQPSWTAAAYLAALTAACMALFFFFFNRKRKQL